MMKLEKKRHLVIVQTLINKGGPCTSEELAIITNTSSRTIKTDMAFIQDVLLSNGATIISKKSSGYSIEILDEELFNEFYNRLSFIQFYYSDYSIALSTELLHILRRILIAEDDYVRIEDIADEIYMSKSSMRQKMIQINKFVQSYNLQLVNKPSYGVRVEGKESDIRMLAVAAFGINYHKAKKHDLEKMNGNLFSYNEEEYQAERKITLKILRENNLRVIDIISQELARYFVIMKNRMNGHHFIYLEEHIKQEIEQFFEYKVAKEILQNIDSFFDKKPTKDEAYFLAMYLLCNRDFLTKEINLENLKHFYYPILDLNYNLLIFLRQRWGIEIESDGFKAFVCNSATFLLKNHFGFLPHPKSTLTARHNVIKKEPLSIAIAQTVANFYCDKLGCSLCAQNVFELAFNVYNQLIKLKYPYKKRRLCTVSGFGINNAVEIVNTVNNYFSDYIDINLPCELYEIRQFNTSEFDYVLIDSPSFVYNYDIPLFNIDLISVNNRKIINELKDEVFLHGFILEKSLKILYETLNIYNDFNVASLKNIFDIISYKYGKDSISSNIINKLINANENRLAQHTYTNTIFLEINREYVKEDIFDIYELNNPLNDEDGFKINYIIVVSFNFLNQSDLLLSINNLSKVIYSNPSYISELIYNDNKYKILKDYIQEALITNN